MTVQPIAVETVAGSEIAIEHDARISALRGWLAGHGADVFVAVSPESVYYLTGLDHLGYFAFTALLVPAGPGAPVVVTRAMERPTVSAQLPGHQHVTFADGADPVMRFVLSSQHTAS